MRHGVHATWIVASFAIGFFSGCPRGCKAKPQDKPVAPATLPSSPSSVVYTDVTQEVGIRFLHRHGGTGEKYLPETMCGGVIAFDYDSDGDIDLYFIQSGNLPWETGQEARNVLYRNDGGRFTDVSEKSGLADDGYGMGGAAADIDNDGDLDIYVTNFGPNRLYRNRGDGTFEDMTDRAGVGDASLGVSAAFADYDRDGRIDLYVVNYLNFTKANHQWCGQRDLGLRGYCHPDLYAGADDVLYKNRGDGTFEDVTRKALPGPIDPDSPDLWLSGRWDGKGLGVIWTDYDLDGDPDIYVANDSTRNYLFKNLDDETFEDEIVAGAGYNDEGMTEGSMGVDAGDIDGDGWFDLFTVHLTGETNTLYVNGRDGTFTDETTRSNLAQVSLRFLGFGTNLLDCDNDGDQDIFIANGNLDDLNVLGGAVAEYAQADLLFLNDGKGRFRDVSRESGAHFSRQMVGRGSAIADFDNDGDIDIAISNNNQSAVLLRNDGGSGNHFILFRIIGTESSRDGIGTLVRIRAGGATQVKEVRSGASYLAQSDLRVHFGIGTAREVDEVRVRWTRGRIETFEGLPADHLFTLEEGRGIVGRQPIRRRP